MKKVLFCLILLLVGCEKKSNVVPKYTVGQTLQVTHGFYANSEYFVPLSYRTYWCNESGEIDLHSSIRTVIYTGNVIVNHTVMGNNVEICENILKPIR